MQRQYPFRPFYALLLLLVSHQTGCAAWNASNLHIQGDEECWNKYWNLSHPVALAAPIQVESSVYLFGGIDQCCPDDASSPIHGTSFIKTMDLQGGSLWRDLPQQLPISIRGFDTVASFGPLFAVGGMSQDANAKAKATSEVLLLDHGTLEAVATPHTNFARRRAAFASNGTELFVLGGIGDSGEPILTVEQLNLGSTSFEVVGILPEPLCDCAVAVHDFEIFKVCSNCSQGGGGDLGVRNLFYSMCLETGDLKQVPFDFADQSFDAGRLVSIAGASIAQYAVFLVFYSNSTNPVVYYWDLYLQQMHVVTTGWMSIPRTHGSIFTSESNLYYAGGQWYPQANVETNVLLESVDWLQVMQNVQVQAVGRSNFTWVVGESIDVRCPKEYIVRLATTPHCSNRAAGTVDLDCNGADTALEMVVSAPAPLAFLCVSRGTCRIPTSERVSCGGKDFHDCNRNGCCWDSNASQCFQYRKPGADEVDRIYFLEGDLTALIVDPAPATSVPDPKSGPSGLSAFIQSTAGVVTLTVGGVFVVAVVIIVVRVLRPSDIGFSGGSFAIIHGKYHIVKKLGHGGFGQVFLVRRKTDNRTFALKYIPCNNDDDRTFALKEFELVKEASGHPNMITIYDMFMNWPEDTATVMTFENGRKGQGPSEEQALIANGANSGLLGEARRYVCIVMTYVGGGDLAHYIHEHVRSVRTIDREWILHTLAKQMCEVLHHLHEREMPIIHRDLKPENVLLSEDRKKIVLTDFGLAQQQITSYLTTRAGSLHYVAPECWKKHYGASVDMWAVGCILYATATGRASATTARVMFNDAKEKGFQKVIRQELTEGADTPEANAFATFILALLQVDPRKRLTAQAALQWLADLKAGKIRTITTNKRNPASPTARPIPPTTTVDIDPAEASLDTIIVNDDRSGV